MLFLEVSRVSFTGLSCGFPPYTANHWVRRQRSLTQKAFQIVLAATHGDLRITSTLARPFTLSGFSTGNRVPTHAGQQMARLALALALCFVGAANGFGGTTPPAREECSDIGLYRYGRDDSPTPTCGSAELGKPCDIDLGEDTFYDAGVCLQLEIPDVSTGA